MGFPVIHSVLILVVLGLSLLETVVVRLVNINIDRIIYDINS